MKIGIALHLATRFFCGGTADTTIVLQKHQVRCVACLFAMRQLLVEAPASSAVLENSGSSANLNNRALFDTTLIIALVIELSTTHIINFAAYK